MIRLHSILFAAMLLVSGCAEGYRYGVSVDVSNAPPPPRFVFHDRPGYIAEYQGGVYVVDAGDYDCDMFRYGSYWYVYTGDYWYRARDYQGPYAAITFESVPDRIIRTVPEERWKHHPHGGPPGQMKKRGRGWTS